MTRWFEPLAVALSLLVGARGVEAGLAAVPGDRWYHGELPLARGLASAVSRRIEADSLPSGAIRTGVARFDGEWTFGTYLMAGFGFAQLAVADATRRADHVASLERCLDRLLDPAVRRFDTEPWRVDAWRALDGPAGHAGYLGYLSVVLGLHRRLQPESRFTERTVVLASALRRWVLAHPRGLVSTYPGETYPMDVTAVYVGIALDDQAAGREPSVDFAHLARLRDPASGLFYQAVTLDEGRPVDEPRGSGTALAAYFLSFVDAGFARELDRAVEQRLAHRVLGYGVVDEYTDGSSSGMDIDSGPIVFGAGVSATGFSLAGARIFGRRDRFVHTYATAHLIGSPRGWNATEGFAAGGPLGDAILFAMLTAQPAGAWRPWVEAQRRRAREAT